MSNKSKKVVAKLEIQVVYSDHEGLTDKDYERLLNYAAKHLANEGLLTPDDANVEVDSFEHSVSIKSE